MNAVISPEETFAERRQSIEQIDRGIQKMSARINASTFQLLVLVREFDERAGFLKWGLSNTAEWLHWRCDMGLSAAREKVRCARALKELTQISRAFEKGALSYSKVRALSRVADAENETSLLQFALRHSTSRVEERCRQMRNVFPDSIADAQRAHARRSVRIWRQPDRACATITVELPLEEAELVASAIDKAAETQAETDLEDTSWNAVQADALVHVARSFLSGSVDKDNSEMRSGAADNYQVVIHVDHAALSQGSGRSDLPLESVRRLTCDGSLIELSENADGEPLNVGRKTRSVPPAIKRALWSRDKGCSFPGCTHKRFVDAHHIKHWSQGGETSLDNLMLLCSKHHRMVHEIGYEIRKDHDDSWYFRRPDGRAVPTLGYNKADYVDEPLGGCRALASRACDSLGPWESSPNPSAEGPQ